MTVNISNWGLFFVFKCQTRAPQATSHYVMYKNIVCVCVCLSASAGGDQGVLNSFFNTWATADISKHLPFIYNLSSIAIYSYLPAFKQSVHTHTLTHIHDQFIQGFFMCSCAAASLPWFCSFPRETSGCFHVWGGIKLIQGQFKGVCVFLCVWSGVGLQEAAGATHTLPQEKMSDCCCTCVLSVWFRSVMYESFWWRV